MRSFVQAHKQALSIISNTNLALLIWQTLSSAQDIIVNTTFGTMLLVILSTFLVHIIYLIFNTGVVMLLRVPAPEAASTVIMASQKVGVWYLRWLSVLRGVRVVGRLPSPSVRKQSGLSPHSRDPL